MLATNESVNWSSSLYARTKWPSGGMADTVDLRSTVLTGMGVRVPPGLPIYEKTFQEKAEKRLCSPGQNQGLQRSYAQ